MDLAEKITILRSLEGNLRGLDRPLAKSEVVRLMKQELGTGISEAYLSQLESGKRPHMTATSRELLARFFKVHPGYLVTDPADYRTALSTLSELETGLDEVLRTAGAALAHSDAEVAGALHDLADAPNTREALLMSARLAAYPELLTRLRAVFGGDGSASEDADADEASGKEGTH